MFLLIETPRTWPVIVTGRCEKSHKSVKLFTDLRITQSGLNFAVTVYIFGLRAAITEAFLCTAFLVVRYTGHCFRQSRTCIIITRLVLFICCRQMSLCVGGDETTRTVGGGGVDRGWGGPQMLAKFVFFSAAARYLLLVDCFTFAQAQGAI